MSKSSEHPALMSSGNIDRVSSGIVKEGINDAPFRVTVMEHIDRPYRVACGLTRQATCGHDQSLDTSIWIADNLPTIHWMIGRGLISRLHRDAVR
jgi:hypothetical protein